ncbi:hypothetical protein C0995_008094 [Termitomyces sp. Mi166|nr:hypothetical protein C0995_008094 [Termitomyces sp. Mi166\
MSQTGSTSTSEASSGSSFKSQSTSFRSTATSTHVAAVTASPTSGRKGGLVKRPIGAIVGGVVGGLFCLAVAGVTIFFCRRKRRNPSNLDLLRATRDINVSPSPSLKDEWLARMDAAMNEAAKQTEGVRYRSRGPPHIPNGGYHDTSGWQSPDTIEDKSWDESHGRALSPATSFPDIYHGEHLQSCFYSDSSGEAGTEGAIGTLAQNYQSSAASGRTIIGRSPVETSEEEFEFERERRREEIFERMRRVLDNDSNSFDSV